MSLRYANFPLKDVGLRDDVGVLGKLVGEIIQEQAGERVFEEVESARRAAIRRRNGDEAAADELSNTLQGITDVSAFIRAFSVFFQVVNLAERVHRIRRRRDYLRADTGPQPGGIGDALQQLVAAGVGLDAFAQTLEKIRIEPVFTAHPTEATRRSVLQKHLRIARRLVERLDPTLPPPEVRRTMARIRSEVTALWQTEEYPEATRTVNDESEHILFFLTEILYRIVPPFYEALEESIRATYGSAAKAFRSPEILAFGSWVGGDMDGNPNVGADTVAATLDKHRRTILGQYRSELEGLYQQLTQSTPQTGVNQDLLDRIADYEGRFPDVVARFPQRHTSMPYRRWVRLLQARLQATAAREPEGYPNAEAFVADVATMAASLKDNRGINAGHFMVERLHRRARTFGFYLAALDLRQDSLVHRMAIAAILGDDTWSDRSPQDRSKILLEQLDRPAELRTDEANAVRTLDVMSAVRRAREEVGPRSIGSYIISMTHGADDILSVLYLAKVGELVEDGQVPLDITPLFETVDDLKAAPAILEDLLAEPAYRNHLASRDNRQTVMIGYSDSGKADGIAAARWALHEAQSTLVDVADRHGVDLTLFHGRGGTISRGGGRIDRAIASVPKAYANGRLRLTEQGEVITQRYGLRDIAERTAEQMLAPLSLAAAGVTRDEADPAWTSIGRTIADESRKAYRALVHENPDFLGYFRNATPIDVIERMQIGSRPASRRAQKGIGDLRAIPWVFAWTQSRHLLTGWYGIATGLRSAKVAHGRDAVVRAIAEWPYLNALIIDVETDLAAADLGIAERYAMLAGEADGPIFGRIREAYQEAVELILDLKGYDELLDREDVLKRSIALRTPYIDPLSLLQVELLGKWREGDREDNDLLALLVGTVHGISQGMQNTG